MPVGARSRIPPVRVGSRIPPSANDYWCPINVMWINIPRYYRIRSRSDHDRCRDITVGVWHDRCSHSNSNSNAPHADANCHLCCISLGRCD
jgi:hypothetical protein